MRLPAPRKLVIWRWSGPLEVEEIITGASKEKGRGTDRVSGE